MASELTNIQSCIKRHAVAGPGLLILAALLFGPRLFDMVRGEPWIQGTLSVFQSSDGRYLVEDSVTTNHPVYGDRQITLETGDGTVLCSSRWSGAWEATTKRNWSLTALAGANCDLQPVEPFRVCSTFSLTSGSGRARSFAPYCSKLTNPSTQTRIDR